MRLVLYRPFTWTLRFLLTFNPCMLSVFVMFSVLRASYAYEFAYAYPHADAILGWGASASRGTGPHSYVGLDGLRRVHIVASAGVKLPQG